MAQVCLARVIPSMHVHLCVALWLFSSPVSFFLFVPLLFFRPFQMSSSEFHKRLKSKDLRDFRLGTVATSDHETPLTVRLAQKDTRRKESTVQDELQLDSCLKQEPIVKNLWQDSGKMASHIRSTVLFVTLHVQFLFANPDHQNTEGSVDDLHRFGKLWLQSYKIFSLNMTPKAMLLFQHLISVPKYSTCLIAGMELECQFSSLPVTRPVVQRHFSWCVCASYV